MVKIVRVLPVALAVAFINSATPAKADPAIAAIVVGSLFAGGLIGAAMEANARPYEVIYPAQPQRYVAPSRYYMTIPVHSGPVVYQQPIAYYYEEAPCYRARVYIRGAWRHTKICY